ncbi:MAG: chemotaxis protein CheW [Planctomycetaceae bacterium]
MSAIGPQSGERYCLLRSGSSWFALPAAKVQEVSFRPAVVPVSPAAPILAGLCHFRNEFLAVLSLRNLLPNMALDETPESQVVVVRGDDGPWVLLVDEVAALESLESASAAETAAEDGWSDVVTAWATFRDHAVRILDPENFYRLAQRALQDGWNPIDDPAVALETVTATV